MNKRLEILEKLLGYVEKDKNITCEYVNEDGCYCAVGFIMNELEVDMNHISNTDLNGEMVFMLPHEIFEKLSVYFNGKELRRIQCLNDGDENECLIEYINSLIKKERVQNEK